MHLPWREDGEDPRALVASDAPRMAAQAGVLALEALLLVADPACGRRGPRQHLVRDNPHAPAAPGGHVRGVDALPAPANTHLPGTRAAVGGLKDAEFVAVAEAAAGGAMRPVRGRIQAWKTGPSAWRTLSVAQIVWSDGECLIIIDT